MAADLNATWSEVAHRWDDYGPPLRVSAEDLLVSRQAMEKWHSENPVARAQVFLCGVTPEIATMAWPFPIELTAMDRVESMVRIVWPGDIPGVRKALVGDWFNSGLPAQSQHIAIGDGGFGFYDFPASQCALMNAMHKLLKPGGLFIYRCYTQISPRESLAAVWHDLRAGRIGSFHSFKWRLAMALQENSTDGVRQDDIWQAWTDARIDPAALGQPGFSQREIGTIDFYRGKQARLYFPTLDEFRGLLAETFGAISVQFPAYELGERCPILCARCK